MVNKLKTMMNTTYLKKIVIIIMLLFSSGIYAAYPTDEEIVNDIESELILEGDTSELDVNITCHNGVVTLEGEVDSINEVYKLIDIARSTSGVIEINTSKLTINKD